MDIEKAVVLEWLRDQAAIFDRRVAELARAIHVYEDLKRFGPHDSERLGNLEHEQRYAQLVSARYHRTIELIEQPDSAPVTGGEP